MKKFILTTIITISVLAFFSNNILAQDNNVQKTLLVINAVVDQEHKQELQGYLSRMMQIFADNGGKPLGRYKTIEKIKGSQVPEMIAIFSFENAEITKRILEGNEYKSLTELRERVFSDLKIILCTELN